MDQLVIPFSDVGLDSAQLADALDDLVPLYFASGDVICRLAGQWHRLSPVTGATIEWILAIHPGARPDQPRITHRRPVLQSGFVIFPANRPGHAGASWGCAC